MNSGTLDLNTRRYVKTLLAGEATAGVAAAHRHSSSEKITTLRRSKLMGLSRCRRGGLLRDPPAHPADWFLVNRMPRVARRSAVATALPEYDTAPRPMHPPRPMVPAFPSLPAKLAPWPASAFCRLARALQRTPSLRVARN